LHAWYKEGMTDGRVERRTFLKGAGAALAVAATGSGWLSACSSKSTKTQTKSPATSAPQTNTGASTATPKPGGTLTWAPWSDIDGFDPTINHWDQAGVACARAVYDPLAIVDANGNLQPYLAQSISHNADYTQWTIVLRPNIVYHDGAPLNAAGVATFLEKVVQSPLFAASSTPVKKIGTSDPLTVVVDLKRTWAAYGIYLSTQVGYPPSPNAWTNPNRARQPVGTGPFVFKEWVPGDHFTAVRNPHYWRKDAGGNQLPYLDQITFRPITDTVSAENSLRAGNVDAIFAGSTQQIVHLRDDKNFWYIDDSKENLGEPDVTFLMINTAKPPLDDLRLRQAMAYATDQSKLIAVALNGVGAPATGPFFPGSPYYSDTGYPQYDLAKAKQLVDAVKADKGAFTIKLGTETTAAGLQLVQNVQDQWHQAGITTQIEQLEAVQFINNAVLGNYDVYTWIQGATIDPDTNYVWWSTDTVAPPGVPALNFARNKDPQIQAALQQARSSNDPAVRVSAYQTIARRLAADIPYVYVSRTVAASMGRLNVQNWNFLTSPEGARAYEYDRDMWPTQIWLS
jgi:ABC-type transport system substrate-binding protein